MKTIKNRLVFLSIFSWFLVIMGNTFLYAQQVKKTYLKVIEDSGKTDFYHIENFGNTDKKSIPYMALDSIGQVWFATKDGLVRYDTHQYYTYKFEPNNQHSIGGNFVERVLVGHDGSVWVGTEPAVLSKYQPETDNFIRINGISGKRVKDIKQDANNLYWITTVKNLYSYNDVTKELKTHHFKEENVSLDKLLITNKQEIYVTTNEHYMLQFFPKTSVFEKIELIQKKDIKHPKTTQFYGAYKLLEDADGAIWIATPYGYLLKYSITTKSLKKYVFFDTFNKSNLFFKDKVGITFLLEDKKHNIWFGTWLNGLYKVLENRKEVLHFMPNKKNEHSLTNNIIHSGFQDKAGYLWFGTEFSGVNILKKNKKFNIIKHQVSKKIKPTNKFRSVVVDKNDHIWIAEDYTGLFYLQKEKSTEFISSNKTFKFNKAYWPFCLFTKDDDLWIGTHNGLLRYNLDTKTIKKFTHNNENYNTILSNKINCIVEDKDGMLWIGTSEGVSRFDVLKNKFYHFTHEKENIKSLSNNYVATIFCDDKNDIWVGTLNGLNKLNRKTGNFTIFKHSDMDVFSISENKITAIYGLNNLVYVGTKTGLNIYNSQKKQFRLLTKKDGLPSNYIKAIASDATNIWFSTPYHLVKLHSNTEQITVYGKSDGLESKEHILNLGRQDLQFSSSFSYKDKKGNLYFGGLSGFCKFHPDSLPVNSYQSSIKLSKFNVNGILKKVIKRIVLQPNENQLEFETTLFNYIQPDKNKYAFYLENYDDDWQYTQQKNTISYYDLPRGNYIFHYKAANNDGVWSVEKQVHIEVLPHFYASKLFYLLVALFIGLIIIGFFIYKKYQKKKLAQQREDLKYSTSSLKEQEIERINQLLINELGVSKMYLEPDLSLHKLAEILQVKPNHLSQVINQKYHQNFNEFINSYRLKDAINLLKNTSLKIEAVAYDAGFNTLSTFNTYFKKMMHLTPSQYRKKFKK